MSASININSLMVSWAISRAGFDISNFTFKNPIVKKWIEGEKRPTLKQLEDFCKKVYLPLGYLFLNEPPQENIPIPFFRTKEKSSFKVSLNIYDTVIRIHQRQNWLRNYLIENEFNPLPFIGKFRNNLNIEQIVNDIRNTLNLEEDWAKKFTNYQSATNHLIEQIEDIGIIVTFNSVVDNNNNRKIPIDECRGFVIVDDYAPFMFVNNADFKSAQIFTIFHELVHLWLGQSAGFDFQNLLSAEDPIEKLCDQIAAELLVPKKLFVKIWDANPSIISCSNYFKVSKIVIARRALDNSKLTYSQFIDFYNDYKQTEFQKQIKQGGGGDFFANTKKRLSLSFSRHIKNAVNSNQLLFRDAYKLTGLKPDTFDKFFSLHV